MPAFYREIKRNGIAVKDIKYVLASHYHPDHIGLISELMKQGVKLLIVDVQKDYIHYSDYIFARDKITYSPIDETLATVISCETSRDLLWDHPHSKPQPGQHIPDSGQRRMLCRGPGTR